MSKAKFKRETVQAALDLIADHGGPRGRADLPDVLAAQCGATFTQRFGQHQVRIGGVFRASRLSAADALENWARAARRRLLKEA